MSPMFKQKVGMTKIYAKGIAELFLIRCNPYHWDGSGEVPDIITFWLKNDATRTRRKGVVEYSESSARFMVRVCESTDVVMLKDCCCIHVIGNVFDGEFDKSESEMKQLYTECLNLAKSIDAIMLCYNPDIDALKAENLSDMAVRLLDGVSRRDVVKDLEDFRDKWRHYNEQAAAESQVILDKISELFEKDGDSK